MPLRSTTIARRTIGYLAVGAAAMLGIVLTALWLAQHVSQHAEDVVRGREIRTAANGVLQALLDAETGQRGYLLTGEDPYLEPYNRAAASLDRELERLRRAVVADATASRAVEQLVPLVEAKMAELAGTVAEKRAGRSDAALARLQSDQGRRLMDQARSLLGGLRGGADTLVDGRLQEVERGVSLLTRVILAGTVLVVVLAAAAAYTALGYTRELAASQLEIAALNAGLEERVRERTAALARANDEIQRFAYIVSHDLRSPLVNIMGFTSELETGVEVLQRYVGEEGGTRSVPVGEARTVANDDIPEALRFIRASTTRMDGLINAILKLSREGRRALQPETVDLAALLAQAAASLQHQLEAAGATIALPAGATVLVTDRLALEQVVGNLLDNAVKYLAKDRPGRIVVAVSRGGGRLRLDVGDNGRGIAAQDHERIFELFRRAGPQDRPGEGIGLAHVRALVRRLGGDITLTSELGRGSTFSVDLPLRLVVTDA
ncbi:MAG: CHASE3 domain-containing protein [Reyranellaceae bacterium]